MAELRGGRQAEGLCICNMLRLKTITLTGFLMGSSIPAQLGIWTGKSKSPAVRAVDLLLVNIVAPVKDEFHGRISWATDG